MYTMDDNNMRYVFYAIFVLEIGNFFRDIGISMYMNNKCTDWQIEKGLAARTYRFSRRDIFHGV